MPLKAATVRARGLVKMQVVEWWPNVYESQFFLLNTRREALSQWRRARLMGTCTQNRRACCLIVSMRISRWAALEGKVGSRPRLCCHAAVCDMLTVEGSDISLVNSSRQQVLLLYCNKLIWDRSRLVLHDEVGWSLLCTLIIFKINMTMPVLDAMGLQE